eukprot:gene4839-3470_t
MLSGTIPVDLFNAKRLSQVFLQENYLVGSIPSDIATTTTIRTLNIFSNLLTGSIPPTLCLIATLQNLNLYSNQLTGPIPSCLGEITNIVVVDLHSNRLSGSVPTTFQFLNGLQTLSLYDNFIGGTVPWTLSTNPQLLALYLNGNVLTGTIPANFTAAILMLLMLQENFLSISLPLLFDPQHFPSLSSLGVSYNTLLSDWQVDIPDNVAYFNMTDVYAHGPLPTQWLRAPNLIFLDVSSNSFYGSIPTSIRKRWWRATK